MSINNLTNQIPNVKNYEIPECLKINKRNERLFLNATGLHDSNRLLVYISGLI